MLPKKNTEGLPWGYSWLRLCAPKEGGPGLIPGQWTEIPHAGVAKLKNKNTEMESCSCLLLAVWTGKFQWLHYVFCCCSVIKSCMTLRNPMDCSTPGLPVPHYLPEFAEAHVHWIGDAIQPSHPLPPFSPFAFNFSQPQGLISNESAVRIRWPSSSGALASASVLPMNIQSWFPLGLTGLISLQFKGLPKIFSSTSL